VYAETQSPSADADTTLSSGGGSEEALYRIIFDSEQKILDAYNNIKEASQPKDWDKITQTQREIYDQLSYNSYQITRLELSPELETMAGTYKNSLQSLMEMFSDAYEHNVGKADYKTINTRLMEAEQKSNEYYSQFLTEFQQVNPTKYNEFIEKFQKTT